MDLAALDIEMRCAPWLAARGARCFAELSEVDKESALAWWLVSGRQRG